MKRIIIATAFAALAVSCTDKTDNGLEPDRNIYLCASVRECLGVQTRTGSGDAQSSGDATPLGDYTVYTETVPSSQHPLYAAVWASTASGDYPGTQSVAGTSTPYVENGPVDYHNTTIFTSGARQLLDYQLFYPDGGPYAGHSSDYEKATVYFIGLCPRSASGWQVEDWDGSGTTAAVHIFDGREDVMFAPQVGKNIDAVGVTPELVFSHLLTWIRIKVLAENDEAITTWGKIHKIEIQSHDKVRINTGNGNTEWAYSSSARTLPCYKVTQGPAYSKDALDFTGNAGISLTQEAQEVAYVLCAPVTASDVADTNEYTLVLNVGGRHNIEVPFNLKNSGGSDFNGSTAGRQFTVTLNFHVGQNISAMAAVTPWENGGISLTQISED